MSLLELSLSENLVSAGAVAAGGALVTLVKAAAVQRVCLAVRGGVVLTVGDVLLGGHHLYCLSHPELNMKLNMCTGVFILLSNRS